MGNNYILTQGTCLSKIRRSGGQIESCVSDVQDPDALGVGRKRSHPISSDDTVMDHSGLEESSSKRSRVCVKDGVMQCLRSPSVGTEPKTWTFGVILSSSSIKVLIHHLL